ncbi:MAG TPA: 4'-phosphopantetheinyl transferase superfamily protein [Solirubrobacteraceae bacterium]|jgi:4'-phosphopantetheinyl transferase|nr:4'-phosphopantetheinyl transferase superfamily protein [Solirubrobacteraceae bacterium]
MGPEPAALNIVICALDELPADACVLDAREIRRAGRLQSDVDRRRFVAAHTALRRELGERLEADPAELEFSRARCSQCGGLHGRPIVLRPGGSLARRADLHFSLSHSGGQGLLAISQAPVGVDIEALPDVTMAQRLAALMHPREQARILSAPKAAQPTLFTRLWCRKEAYLKGVGIGLAHDTTEGYLSSLESTPGWRVANVETPDGFAGAVATTAPAVP